MDAGWPRTNRSALSPSRPSSETVTIS
ncbi:hypothetical protein BDFB_009572 [Asbolus verrucosus]|uniref:Uncharacterized protein n=1 Tax=Asbolus verrucosus TaxID=1661398 RepID=A0A482VKY0_ASBVE|nr:hypothetical protein BDFB_009572 [Asbolus verrucosus]